MSQEFVVTDPDVARLSLWTWKRLDRYMSVVQAQMRTRKVGLDESVMGRLQIRERLCSMARMKKLDRENLIA